MEYKLASVGRRFGALVIDGIIVSFLTGLVTFPFGLWPFGNLDWAHSGFSIVKYSGVMFFVALVYYSLLEAGTSHATFGKKLLGIAVLDMDGQGLTLSKSLVRNLAKIVSGNLFVLGFAFAFFTRKNQALHDLLGGTVVVDTGEVAKEVAE